jgi:ElaB/YqjD/DUF883 family membrane-anchored ribosome-binding protein
MEVYFRDLISEEKSLDKLVDDLALVVQGVDDFARAVGANLSPQSREELAGRLDRLKEKCRCLKEQAIAGARATDKLLREHPYWSLAAVFSLGLVLGATFCRRRAE